MRKIYGYARVSTKEQNLDRQILALQKFGIDDRDIIRDKASGKTLDREGYKLLRNHFLREGDSLVIMSLDRLSRNKLHIRQELEFYKQRRIRVMILDMPTTLTEVPEGQEWIIDMINTSLSRCFPVLQSRREYVHLSARHRALRLRNRRESI